MFVKLLIPVLLAVSSTVTPVVSLATPESSTNFARDDYGGPPEDNSTVKFPAPFNDTAKRFPDIQLLWEGNEAFRSEIANSSNPNQLKDLVTNGHRPEFLFLGCSDSRTSEGTIFDAPLDTLFAQRNIANQFQPSDNNSISVLSYGVHALAVGHVIIMGHYGCGGVQAAMLPKPNTTDDFWADSVQSWINPIRHIYSTSNRSEIASSREANKGNTTVEPPKYDDPAFRALIEENVKHTVSDVTASPVMKQHWAAYIAQEGSQGGTSHRRAPSDSTALKPVYVHGFVYDISTGDVIDLGVSYGPHGAATEAPALGAVKRAAIHQARGHAHL